MLEDKLEKWKSDFQSYAEENLCIITKPPETKIVPFKFNRMQIKLWLLLLEQLKAGQPIRWLIVKDRQLGCSTFICGFLFWLCTMFPNKGALQINYDADSATGLFEKIKLFFKMLSPEMKPMRKISNRKELYFANPDDEGPLGLESRIRIDTADSEELGVSYTLSAAHLSEMSVWQEMGLDIKKRMGALNQSIPLSAGTFIFIETTPRGEGYVQEMYDSQENGYTKIFLSSVSDEQYRIDISPSDYFELMDYEEHKYGDETEEYEHYETEVKYWYPEFDETTPEGMQKINHEVMCRLAWRRLMIDKQCEGDKGFFDREYPITIEKAFSSSGSNLFNVQQLKQIKKYLIEHPPQFARYKFTESELKSLKSPIPGDFYNAPYGPLKVFLQPDPKFKYIIGGDGAQGGKGGDPSALVGRRVPDLKLAFTFSETIDPYTFSKIAYCLCKIYNNAFIGLEDNEKGGFATIEYLLNHWKYTNQYVREVWGKIGDPQTEKYGWHTGRNTKPTMISDMREAMRNGEIQLLDIEEVEQLIKYKELKNGHSGAVTGFDDLAIADMICLQMAKYVSCYVPEAPKKYKYTWDWWASLTENTITDQIGYTPRGGY